MREFELYIPNLYEPGGEVAPLCLKIRCDDNITIGRRLQNYGVREFEPETFSTILAICRFANDQTSKLCFIDVGANIGLYSFTVSRIFGKNATVLAFEPFPATYSVMDTIRKDNDLGLVPFNIALSNSSGIQHFYLSQKSDTSHSLKLNTRKFSGDVIKVKATTLDQHLEPLNTIPDLIKIDTEGTELNVIQGALRTIEAHQPMIILEVLRNKDGRAITHLMRTEFPNYLFYHMTEEACWPVEQEIKRLGNKGRNWLLTPRQLDDSFFTERIFLESLLKNTHKPLRTARRSVLADGFFSRRHELAPNTSYRIYVGSSDGQIFVSANDVRYSGGFAYSVRSTHSQIHRLFGVSDKIVVDSSKKRAATGVMGVSAESGGWITIENRTDNARSITITVLGML